MDAGLHCESQRCEPREVHEVGVGLRNGVALNKRRGEQRDRRLVGVDTCHCRQFGQIEWGLALSKVNRQFLEFGQACQ